MPIDAIIIDFDHTLFNTEAFKHDLAGALAPFGVTAAQYAETYPSALQVRHGEFGYRPEAHVEILARAGVVSDRAGATKVLEEVVTNSQRYLYPDTKDFLSRLVGLNVKLILASRGDREFQMKKITSSGVDRFFHAVHTTPALKVALFPHILPANARRAFLIDDSVEEIRAVLERYPEVIPILKRRPDLPPEYFRDVGMMNFGTLTEMKDYLTIVHATSYER